MTEKSKPADLREALAKVAEEGTLPLGAYVRANLSDIKAQFAAGHSWDEITIAMGKLGVRDHNGQPPKKKTVHQAVSRAEQQRKKRKSRAQPTAPAAPRPTPRPEARAKTKSKHWSSLWDEDTGDAK